MAREQLQVRALELTRQRAALFDRGAQSASNTLQVIRARQVKTVDLQLQRVARLVEITGLQARVLGHLIYARETGDRLGSGPLASVNWVSLLEDTSRIAARQETALSELRQVAAVLAPPAPAPEARPAELVSLVKHVPDGDGLKLADGRRVRYIGIDAPEVSGYDGQPQLLAVEARDLNKQLVEGKWVRLVADTSDTDRYGRMLRYVYAGDVFVNAEMVRAGLATALTVFPDEQHAAEFRQLEEQARHARLGLWAHGYT
jgi:endonuclease YncB( thermonuclease family)